MNKNDFRKLAERFIKYLKEDDFSETFQFTLNDGESDFGFGTVYVSEFDNVLFVTSMYGDNAANGTQSILKFEGDIECWDDYVDFVTDYYYDNYKDWNVVE